MGQDISTPGQQLTINRKSYIFMKKLGDGTFAEVFHLTDLSHPPRHFALKKMNVPPERINQVKNELRSMRICGKHPHCLDLIDVMEYNHQGRHVVLMLLPLCRDNLFDFVKRYEAKKFPVPENILISILRQMTLGVAHMHSQKTPLVHRDLKIDNIFLQENRWVLGDFGSVYEGKMFHATTRQLAAKMQDELDRFTTPLYRPPEQVQVNEGDKIDMTKGDIWALGVVLYFLACFAPPFETFLATTSGCPKIPLHIQNAYSAEFIYLFHYLFTLDHHRRPSAKEILQHLNIFWDSSGRRTTASLSSQGLSIPVSKKSTSVLVRKTKKKSKKSKHQPLPNTVVTCTVGPNSLSNVPTTFQQTSTNDPFSSFSPQPSQKSFSQSDPFAQFSVQSQNPSMNQSLPQSNPSQIPPYRQNQFIQTPQFQSRQDSNSPHQYQPQIHQTVHNGHNNPQNQFLSPQKRNNQHFHPQFPNRTSTFVDMSGSNTSSPLTLGYTKSPIVRPNAPNPSAFSAAQSFPDQKSTSKSSSTNSDPFSRFLTPQQSKPSRPLVPSASANFLRPPQSLSFTTSSSEENLVSLGDSFGHSTPPKPSAWVNNLGQKSIPQASSSPTLSSLDTFQSSPMNPMKPRVNQQQRMYQQQSLPFPQTNRQSQPINTLFPPQNQQSQLSQFYQNQIPSYQLQQQPPTPSQQPNNDPFSSFIQNNLQHQTSTQNQDDPFRNFTKHG